MQTVFVAAAPHADLHTGLLATLCADGTTKPNASEHSLQRILIQLTSRYSGSYREDKTKEMT
eukprot:5287933-Amphidinium_carterae.1